MPIAQMVDLPPEDMDEDEDGVVVVAESPAPQDLQWRRLLDRNTAMARRIKELEAKAIGLEDLLAQMRSCQNVEIPALPWTQKAPAVAGQTTLMPVLFTSDFQTGEVIKPEEIDGLNAYNQFIFCQRYEHLIDKSIDLITRNTGGTDFPGFFYLRGGDAVSRGLHPDLAETDDLTTIPALALLFKYEREGIRKLRARFGRVHVITVPGNHGRTTDKPRSKGYVERSYETMLAWWLASAFEDDPNVTFSAPASGDAFFQVLGWNYLMSHGDRMGSRGGQGFVGPIATISRGHQKLHANYASSGLQAHVILTGHLHTSCKTELGYGNGALAGYSQYARDFRARPAPASQWLLTVHEKRRVAHHFEVTCSPDPRRDILQPIDMGPES
jgi:hypothetical protein